MLKTFLFSKITFSTLANTCQESKKLLILFDFSLCKQKKRDKTMKAKETGKINGRFI